MAEARESAAGRPTVVSFPERVDSSNAARIRTQLVEAFDHGAAVLIVDMSATASCDRAGARLVAWACQRAAIRRVDLRLVVNEPDVRRLLAAEGLDRLVPAYTSLAAAVAAREPDGPVPAAAPAPPAAATPWPRPLRAGRDAGPGPASFGEALLRQLIDVLADGIVLADEDGRIVLANRRGAAMFGYQPGELDGQPVESLIPASLRNVHRLERAAYAHKPVARPMADRARLVGVCKDGTTIPLLITLSPVPTTSGHFILTVIRDATRERYQDDLAELVCAVAAQQAGQVKDMLDRVVNSLFHVGLSLHTAADQPADLARVRLGEALERLDDTIHEVRDYVFRSPGPGGDGEAAR